MEILALYDKRDAQYLAAAMALYLKHNNGTDTITFKEVSAMDDATGTDAIGTYVGTLTDGTYSYIYVFAAITDAGDVGVLNYTTYGLLAPKLTAANLAASLVTTGTSPGGGVSSTSKLVLAGGDVEADGFYKDYLMVVTGTAAGSYGVLTSDQSDANVEIGGAVATEAFDASSVYSLYDATGYIKVYSTANSTTSGVITYRNPAYYTSYQAWSDLFTYVEMPLVFSWLGGTVSPLGIAWDKVTADSATATTLTDTGAFTGLDLTGYYVHIYTASTSGGNQYGKIASNTDDVLTLESPGFSLGLAPAGTILYTIVKDEWQAQADVASMLAIKSLYWDITSPTTINAWKSMIDNDPDKRLWQKEANGIVIRAEQDIDFLRNTLLANGKIINAYGAIFYPTLA